MLMPLFQIREIWTNLKLIGVKFLGQMIEVFS